MHYKLFQKIIENMEKGKFYSQKQIASEIEPVNRAILTGYLRCLYDLGKLESKDAGKAKIYFLKGGTKDEK